MRAVIFLSIHQLHGFQLLDRRQGEAWFARVLANDIYLETNKGGAFSPTYSEHCITNDKQVMGKKKRGLRELT